MYFQVLTYLCLFINGFPAEVQCKIKTEIYQNVSQYDIQKLKAAIYQMSLEIQQNSEKGSAGKHSIIQK